MLVTAVKCVIWDLDDTLWDGSLAENDAVRPRPHLIDLICQLDAKGIINSICSKNSYTGSKEVLQSLCIWDYLVFPSIDFVPKGESVSAIITKLRLRPENVLFVDDNIGNRNEVEYYCKGIATADPNAEDFLASMIQLVERANGVSRLEQYKLLERKSEDMARSADNSRFLADSDITMCVLRNPADLMFQERILELANRSHQLNFTRSKFRDLEELHAYLTNDQSIHIHHGVVWVYDKYGDYGLVGFYAVDERLRRPQVEHFVFSCRVLHMGIEQALYSLLRSECGIGPIDAIEARRSKDTSYIRVIRQLDERLRNHIDQKLAMPARYTSSVVAGCASGILDHYLGEDMRPARFDLSVLADFGRSLPLADCVIYAVYSDYVNAPWTAVGGFSYVRFQRHLVEFLRNHQDRTIYLLLSSERTFPWDAADLYSSAMVYLDRLRSSVIYGKSSRRFRRCNELVREAAAKYYNVTVIETGDFVRAAEEQLDRAHFDRIVLKRVCDYIGRLREPAISRIPKAG